MWGESKWLSARSRIDQNPSKRALSDDLRSTLVDLGGSKTPFRVISARSGIDLGRSGSSLVNLGRSWLDRALDQGSMWFDLGRSWTIWGSIWVDLGWVWVDVDRSRSMLKANMLTLSKHLVLRVQMALRTIQNRQKSVEESSFGRSSIDFG